MNTPTDQFSLKVTNKFTTKVDVYIEKGVEPQGIMYFSHGFGVNRNCKKLFPDIASFLSKK